MENPFKFGTIVEEEFFTDRVQEVEYISHFIDSANHLILISPRRFGKSSVVRKAVKQTKRPSISINLQEVVSVSDFAAKVLRELFKLHPLEKLRHQFMHFRVVPTLTANPITGAIEVGFQPTQDSLVLLEDALNLLENCYTNQNRLVVVFDEFQEIRDLSPHLEKQLRAIMQHQQHINYILLGSQESMMTDIFENKKSPFYHFGGLMRLQKLPRKEFEEFIFLRLQPCFPNEANLLTQKILDYTDCHPYYSQQLAAYVWQVGMLQPEKPDAMRAAIEHIVTTHGLDYERIWNTFNRTAKWILMRLAKGEAFQTGEYRTSTIYSALKRLQQLGYVIYSNQYEIEDPFFKEWLMQI